MTSGSWRSVAPSGLSAAIARRLKDQHDRHDEEFNDRWQHSVHAQKFLLHLHQFESWLGMDQALLDAALLGRPPSHRLRQCSTQRENSSSPQPPSGLAKKGRKRKAQSVGAARERCPFGCTRTGCVDAPNRGARCFNPNVGSNSFHDLVVRVCLHKQC